MSKPHTSTYKVRVACQFIPTLVSSRKLGAVLATVEVCTTMSVACRFFFDMVLLSFPVKLPTAKLSAPRTRHRFLLQRS